MTHSFEVDATNPADVSVLVDGHQQRDRLMRASVDVVAGAMPTLYLQFGMGGQISGVGDVVIQQAGPEAIRAWLDTLDPDAVERGALAEQEREPMSFGAAVLAYLGKAAADGGT